MYQFDRTPDHKHNGSYRWDLPDIPDDVIGMGTADLDFYCAPCIKEALVPIAAENCYNYRQRSDAYYNAVISWYDRLYGLKIKKEWISSVPSTIGAVRMALGIYAKPGDNVIVQTPVFSPIAVAIDGADCTLLSNPMKIVNGRYEIDFDDFEAKIKHFHPSVFLMVNPHNPTGRVFSRKELERLVSICLENNVVIVSDEVHSMIVYSGAEFIPLLAVGENAKKCGVQIVSLSKGYNIMSLPHAIITIANDEMRKKWMNQIQAFSFGYATNSFSIAAVTTIMQGNADNWMKELIEYLKGNLDFILETIEKEKIPLKPFIPEAGFLLWLDAKDAGIGKRNLDRFFMDRAHIHLDDGLDNFGEEGEGYIRINFALKRKDIEEAMRRIVSIFK